MSQFYKYDSEDVLRLKIKLLAIYMVVTIVLILWVGGSNLALLDWLVLQLGNAVEGIAPLKGAL